MFSTTGTIWTHNIYKKFRLLILITYCIRKILLALVHFMNNAEQYTARTFKI